MACAIPAPLEVTRVQMHSSVMNKGVVECVPVHESPLKCVVTKMVQWVLMRFRFVCTCTFRLHILEQLCWAVVRSVNNEQLSVIRSLHCCSANIQSGIVARKKLIILRDLFVTSRKPRNPRIQSNFSSIISRFLFIFF